MLWRSYVFVGSSQKQPNPTENSCCNFCTPLTLLLLLLPLLLLLLVKPVPPRSHVWISQNWYVVLAQNASNTNTPLSNDQQYYGKVERKLETSMS